MITKRQNRINAEAVMKHPWMTTNLGTNKQMELNVSGLRTFYRGNKLKRYALSVIASQLSESEINDLAKIFLNLDKDGDGLLSYDELMSGLKNYTANCDD